MATDLLRLVVRMDGWPGAPGFMTFYSQNAVNTMRPAVIAFLNAVKINFPSVVTFTVPTEGDIINDATGELAGTWTGGSSFTTTGGTAGAFAAPAGACITWSTGTTVVGPSGRARRLKGRTFLVPLHPVVFANDGTITDATLTALRNAASTLWVDGDLAVWHRPFGAGGNGSSVPVNGSAVSDRAAVLTSRRA